MPSVSQMEDVWMREITTSKFISGGNQNDNIYVPDTGALLIAVGTGVLGGALGGASVGPAGMIVGGIAGGTVAAVTTMSIDAYNINQSFKG